MRIIQAFASATLAIAYASCASAQPARVPETPLGTIGALLPAPTPERFVQTETFRLWPGRAPGAASDAPADTPTITVFRPQAGRSNGSAVVIAPGGAYVALAGILEGVEPAAWFTSHGVTAFVLSYRVGGGARLPTPLLDGARAMRFVRAHAAEFKIDATRIGMMGFSAGGHLAATTAVESTPGLQDAPDPIERASSRPDFLILAYPWLEGMQLMADGHSQYCDFALRTSNVPCDPKDYVAFAPLSRVSGNAPPTFIYHTTEDELVAPEGSMKFYSALRGSNVPVEMHLFGSGKHGTGMGGSSPSLARWPQLLEEWLRARSILPMR